MIYGYTKLHSSIITSTIWRESPATCKVWVTMLALADANGEIQASVPGLADMARVSVEQTEAALATLLAPDKYSRTPDHQGRRIEAIDGGWRVLNHGKYREKLSQEEIREQARIRQQRKRERDAAVTPKRDASVTERDEREMSRMSRQSESESESQSESKPEAEAKNKTNPSARPSDEQPESSILVSDLRPTKQQLEAFASEAYDEYPRKVARARALKAIGAAIQSIAHRDFRGDLRVATEWLKGRVRLYAQSAEGNRTDSKYIPHPATWFNSGRYDDDEAEWEQAGIPRDAGSRHAAEGAEAEFESPGFVEIQNRPIPTWLKEKHGND